MTMEYGTITGRLVAAVADTTDDPDVNPDIVPISGTVTFTPSVKAILVVSEDITVVPAPIVAALDANGYVSLNGVQGVTVLATNSTYYNPTGWTYRVSFDNLSANGRRVTFDPYNIEVPIGANVDLSFVTPITGSTGTAIVRGPKGDTGAPGGTFTYASGTQTYTASGSSNPIPALDGQSQLPPAVRARVASNLGDTATPEGSAVNVVTSPLAAPARAASVRTPARFLGQPKSLSVAYTNLVGMLSDGITKVITNSGFSAGQIGVTVDGTSVTWGKNFEGGNGQTVSLIETAGGEVLVSVQHRDNTPATLYRSTGWNPATADATSWTSVLTGSGTGVNFDGRWSLTQRSVAPSWSARPGGIFVAEYGFHVSESTTPEQAAMHAYMSLDDGLTWSLIFNLNDYRADTNAHIHAIAYDPWDDRVLITVGDNANAAIYYCDGSKLSSPVWSPIAGTVGSSSNQVTTIVPMSASLVLLSDSPVSAIRSIPRSGYRGYGAMRTLLAIAGGGGTATIGAHAWQTGQDTPALLTVYSTTSSGVPSVYASTDGRTAKAVYSDYQSVTTGTGITSVFGPDVNGDVWATRNTSGSGKLVRFPLRPSGERALGPISEAGKYGLLAHTYPAHVAGGSSSSALVSGTLYVMRVVSEFDATFAARTVRTYQGSAGSGLTLAKAAVYDQSGALLGSVSADASAQFNTAGPTGRTLSVGSFALAHGEPYYIAFLVVGTTGPGISRTSADSRTNMGLAGASLLWGTGPTGLTDMPSSFDPTAMSAQNLALWFGLS